MAFCGPGGGRKKGVVGVQRLPGLSERADANLLSPAALGPGQAHKGRKRGEVAGAHWTPWPHLFGGLLLPSTCWELHLFAYGFF